MIRRIFRVPVGARQLTQMTPLKVLFAIFEAMIIIYLRFINNFATTVPIEFAVRLMTSSPH